MSVSEQASITIKPVISYPQIAQVGKSYLMSIDLQLTTGYDSWPFKKEEEFPVWFILKTMPLFSYKPVRDGESTVVLHRFGGTYGPAMFLLTAAQQEMTGKIEITLVNRWGVPIERITLESTITSETLPVVDSGRRMPVPGRVSRDDSQQNPSVEERIDDEVPSSHQAEQEQYEEIEEEGITNESELNDETSTSDFTFHDPFDSFTDREEILALFERTLRSARPGQVCVLAVKGNSGTGKTFLLSYLADRIYPALKWQSSMISFSQSTPDFWQILMGLEDALRGCVPRESLREYRSRRDEYNRRFDEYRATIVIQQNVTASGQSSITEIEPMDQYRKRELQLRSELTRALIELAEESERPLCFFIDGYERLTETDLNLASWLWEEVILGLERATPQPLGVMTCGWEWPNDASIKTVAQYIELHDFDQAQVRSYLEKRGIITATPSLSQESDELVAAFYDLTRGLPLVLELVVMYFNELLDDQWTADKLRASRPLIYERLHEVYIVDSLLSRLSEPYRTLLELGSVLRFFDQKVLQALLVGTKVRRFDDRTFRRFLDYPFVSAASGSDADSAVKAWRFHPLVRQVQLAYLRIQEPATKAGLDQIVADYYSNLMSGSKHDAKWLAEVSRREFAAVLEWFYHTLQIPHRQGKAFEEWDNLTGLALEGRRSLQARQLLELVQQLADEGEPMLNGASSPYRHYLIRFAQFLEQEKRLEEARVIFEQAASISEQSEKFSPLATGIPNDLLSRLHTILLECEQLDNDESLLLTFSDSLLAPWHNQVPQGASSKDERVNQLINFLINRHRPDTQTSALVLFLGILRDQTLEGDVLHSQIASLVEDLNAIPDFGPQSEKTDFREEVNPQNQQIVSAVEEETLVEGVQTVGRVNVAQIVDGKPTNRFSAGTGWLVAPELILTCWHVISAGRSYNNSIREIDLQAQVENTTFVFDYTLSGQSTEYLISSVVSYDEQLDYALLRLQVRTDQSLNQLGFLQLNIDDPLTPQTPLYIIQFPKGQPQQTSTGYFVKEKDNQPDRILHTAPSEPGTSGSPVLNGLNWKVIGLQIGQDSKTSLQEATLMKAIVAHIQRASPDVYRLITAMR